MFYVCAIDKRKNLKNVLNEVTDWRVVDREFILSDSSSLSQNRKNKELLHIPGANQLRMSLPFLRAAPVPGFPSLPPITSQHSPEEAIGFLALIFLRECLGFLGLGHILLCPSHCCLCFRNPTTTAGPRLAYTSTWNSSKKPFYFRDLTVSSFQLSAII